MAFLTKLDQVAEKLRERIIAGEYARGQKIKQVDIAGELGVSVTPVREALKMLEMEGYIVSQPHKGLCVPEVNYKEVLEVFELRLILERELTIRALEQMTDEGLNSLKAIQKEFVKYSKAGEVIEARAANVRFHFRLYEMAARPLTLQFVRVLWAKYQFNYQKQTERLKHVENEHDFFLKAVEGGDITKASDAMCAHLMSGWERTNKSMQVELEKKSA